ncbi:hypothetical protein LZF95_08630 [Algoriphagus sp. AGSA1]|uniref:hypothetical protein n=1 Tax=Algoriphagus sp. AGSA1 TaxID=2907213 RepID=UPI001F3D6D96|nr:hypothetical protein [Algoriphagus sp. AGSA1]MCE7054736.1 hypothetical protein [Algoriphagus sp. AGSA1]
MKSKLHFIAILFFYISNFNVDTLAQTISLSPVSTKVWAGETVEYTRSSISGCNDYGWTASLGVFPDFQDAQSIITSATKVKVKWNMTNLPDAAINVSCGGGANGSVSNIRILSLVNFNPGGMSGPSQSVQFCSKPTAWYGIAPAIIPNSESPGNPPKVASGYEWTIPPGWTGPNGATGTFRIDEPTASSIQLTPGNCAGGEIKVRAYTDTEGKGTPHYSNYSIPYM